MAYKKEKGMAKSDLIETEGIVTEVMPGARFKVQLKNNHITTCYLSGKLQTNSIKIIEGDTVKIEISPYDLSRGRIVWRDKNSN